MTNCNLDQCQDPKRSIILQNGISGQNCIEFYDSDGVLGGTICLAPTGVEINSLRLTNLTTVERDALAPAAGMVIFNTTEKIGQIYNGLAWCDFGCPEMPAPLATYQFDDAADLGKDTSGNGYHLTNVNGVTQVSNTDFGLGYATNYARPSAQYLGDYNNLDGPQIVGDFSFFCIFDILSKPGNMQVAMTNVTSNLADTALSITWRNTGSQISVSVGDGSSSSYALFGDADLATRVMIGVTVRDRTVTTIRRGGLYIKRDHVLSADHVTGTIVTLGSLLGVADSLDGNIYSAIVFDEALSQGQLEFLYNNGHGRIWTGSEWI